MLKINRILFSTGETIKIINSEKKETLLASRTRKLNRHLMMKSVC